MTKPPTGKPRGRPKKKVVKARKHIRPGRYTCDLMHTTDITENAKRPEYVGALRDYVGPAEAERHAAVLDQAISLKTLTRRKWT